MDNEIAFDDRELDLRSEPTLVEGRNGKMRQKTRIELAREYIHDYGEEEYVKFLLAEKMYNPKGIRIKNADLAQKIIDAGLQK